MSLSELDFSIRIATTAADLREACAVRAEAYGHHMPELGARFAAAEALDLAPGTAVLLARDKRSGRGVGTARIQTSQFGPLLIEGSASLPDGLAGQPRAEITRLAVAAGADPQVKLCLMKASYLFCLASQLRWMVVGARSEALIRNYRRLGFSAVLPEGVRVPLAHAGNLPHELLAFDVTAAERTWRASGHRLYEFMVGTFHADLQLFNHQPLPASTSTAPRAMRPMATRWQRRPDAQPRQLHQPRRSRQSSQPRELGGAQRASTVASSSRV